MSSKRPTRFTSRVLYDHPELERATDEQVRRVFEKRATTESVWLERAYVPYEKGAWQTVLQAEPRYADLARWKSVQNKVAQRPGLVMQRHTWGDRRILAQLRPFKFGDLDLDNAYLLDKYGQEDDGVFVRDWYHDHDNPMYHHHYGGLVFGDEDRYFKPPSYFKPLFVDAHLKDPASEWRTSAQRQRIQAPQDAWKEYHEHIAKGHGGSDKGPMFHSHPISYAGHVKRRHNGQLLKGRHNHPQHAKYLYAPGEECRLLDVHPSAWLLLEAGGPVVYFALEGVLKNDAILSTGAPVVNAGSVTLWEDPALGWLATNYLSRFGMVVVVPDSDWAGNPLVWSQAHEVVKRLASWNVPAIVAAPPATCGMSCQDLTRDVGGGLFLPDAGHKQGVDDWLGNGGTLNEMIVMPKTAEKQLPELMRRRIDQFERDSALIEHYREIAGPDGLVVSPSRTVGAAIHRGKDAVREGNQSLERQGIITPVDPEPYTNLTRADRRPLTALRIDPSLIPDRELMTLGEVLDTIR
jgi:hypothetical protein